MLKFFQCDKVAFCVKRVVLHYNNFQVCSPACSKKGQKQRSNVETEYIESIHTDFAIDVTKVKPFSTVIQLDQRGYSTGKGKEGKGSLWIKSIMKETARHATGNPLIMIDGVLTDSVGYLISINPSQIKSFSVVNSRSKLRPYGAPGKHGILAIETIVGKPRGLQSKSSLFIKGIDRFPSVCPPFRKTRGATSLTFDLRYSGIRIWLLVRDALINPFLFGR